MKFSLNNLEETKDVANKILADLKPGAGAVVLAMEGDLGSGKTTLSQFIGQVLGVEDNMPSPTFLLEKVYELKDQKWQRLIHIDAYRLEKEEEFLNLGWEKLVADPANLILIEWSNRVKNILPKSAIHIVLRHAEESSQEGGREIEINTP